LKGRGRLQREGRLFLAVSKFIADLLIAQGFPGDRVKVHYTGVDREFFRPESGVNREPVVLFVGRLVEVKGCEHAIRAFGELGKAADGPRLVIIGDGPLRAKLEVMAKSLGIRCTFLGSQPRETVRMWMNRARLLCVPSHRTAQGHTEGFGMVFAEAQAMGLPVVSFVSGGIPEVVADGVTGCLVPEGNWRELVQPLRRLLEDEELWQRFSDAGQRRVAAEFDLANQTTRLEAIYESVISESRK
jgi:glycosyltransferase involved in cell wall biosynthesis